MGSPTTARHLKSRELPIEPHLLNVQRQREDMPGVTARLYRIRYEIGCRNDAAVPDLQGVSV